MAYLFFKKDLGFEVPQMVWATQKTCLLGLDFEFKVWRLMTQPESNHAGFALLCFEPKHTFSLIYPKRALEQRKSLALI